MAGQRYDQRQGTTPWILVGVIIAGVLMLIGGIVSGNPTGAALAVLVAGIAIRSTRGR